MNVQEQFAAGMGRMGPETVRLKLQSRLLGDWQYAPAIEWLAHKDAETARQLEACPTQEALTATQAKTTDMRVNATLIVITSLGLIVAVLSRLFPRH